jgi:hypothetical protein
MQPPTTQSLPKRHAILQKKKVFQVALLNTKSGLSVGNILGHWRFEIFFFCQAAAKAIAAKGGSKANTLKQQLKHEQILYFSVCTP